MAYTRKFLKSLGLSEEQEEAAMEAHVEVVNALKAENEDLKEQLSGAEAVKKELDALKKGDFKKKFEDLTKEYADYRADVEGKAEKAAKKAAARAYFEGKSITGKNLEIALRGAREEINGLVLEDGKIKDTASLDGLVSGDFAGLVVKTSTKGADTATPPASGTSKPTKQEILAIKDTAERQKAISENLDLFI